MTRVEAGIEIEATLADAWEMYFDPRRWASWVDGFGSVVSLDGYPEPGGRLVWRSTPAGRGTVTEIVVAHEPRRLHRIEFSDPESAGTLETRFEMHPGPSGSSEHRAGVTQVLDYRLESGGPLRAITDALFIRSQMRRSLQRSLGGLAAELAGPGRADANG